MIRWLMCTFLLVGCLAGGAETAFAQTSDAEKMEVLSVVQTLFDGIAQKSPDLLHSALHPEARLLSVSGDLGSDAVRLVPASDWVSSISARTAELREEMHDPTVRIDGHIATVWAPYEFYVNEEFSHCGVDNVSLIRVSGEWKIVFLNYTTRRGEVCAGSR